MVYAYRWFLALFILLMIMGGGYTYQIKPLWMDIERLYAEETQLSADIARAKLVMRQQNQLKMPQKIMPKYKQSELASEMLAHLQKSGLALKSLHFLPRSLGKDNEFVTVKLTAQGDFSHLAALIRGLNAAPHPLVLLDFSYAADAHQPFLFTAHLALFHHGVQKVNVPLIQEKQPAHPFCATLPFVHEGGGKAAMKTTVFSLTTLKKVGYVEQGKERTALFLLPNQTIVSVAVGDRIGREKGKIVAIKKDQVVIVLPQGQRMMLS